MEEISKLKTVETPAISKAVSKSHTFALTKIIFI